MRNSLVPPTIESTSTSQSTGEPGHTQCIEPALITLTNEQFKMLLANVNPGHNIMSNLPANARNMLEQIGKYKGWDMLMPIGRWLQSFEKAMHESHVKMRAA